MVRRPSANWPKGEQALQRRCGADDNGVVFSLNWKIAPAFADRGRDQRSKEGSREFLL